MSRNIKKARITRISKVKADRSLEERVTALEKQLTDMQAKVSCKLAPSIGSIDISELKKSNGSIVCRIGML